ncbi:MAG TPA: GntR family transcriptional regulator [Solirubrobacteraceae bacterium]|nr:GntR family transcriptional regulator [Solirubrobacteraceae bacterium]
MSADTSLLGRPAAPLNRNASDVASELIRDAILYGRLLPGERLKEEQLARDLGLSRTPVREALLLLQAEGLIESVPNRGAVVRAFSSTELADMYDLRAMLESYAARRAATRVSEDQLVELQGSCQRFRTARLAHDVTAMTRENLRFHFTIAEAAGTPKLAELVRGAIQVPLVASSFSWYTKRLSQRSEDFHRRILAALASRDPERAELLMKEHIYEGRDALVLRVQRSEAASERALGRGGSA